MNNLVKDVDVLTSLATEAERLKEDCEYSSKGHFEAARIWGRWNLRLGIPAALLGAGAGASAFGNFSVLAGTLAIFGGALTAILTFLKPNEHTSTHQQAGARYNTLRNQVRFFKEIDIGSGANPQILTRKLRKLSEQRNKLNEVSPGIPRPAFESARRGIESGEAQYRIDQQTAHVEAE